MKFPERIILLLVLMITMNGCDFIGDVIEFSFWTGAVFFLIVVLLIAWLVRKLRGRG